MLPVAITMTQLKKFTKSEVNLLKDLHTKYEHKGRRRWRWIVQGFNSSRYAQRTRESLISKWKSLERKALAATRAGSDADDLSAIPAVLLDAQEQIGSKDGEVVQELVTQGPHYLCGVERSELRDIVGNTGVETDGPSVVFTHTVQHMLHDRIWVEDVRLIVP